MVTKKTGSYHFKSFELKVLERQLLQAGKPVPLTPKVFDVLVYLVERHGHLVAKDDLLQAVWPDAFIEEGNLSRSIHQLRRVLGQDKNGNKFIETVPTKGYRFVAEVESKADNVLESETEFPNDVHTSDSPTTSEAVRHEPRPLLIAAVLFIVAVAGLGFWFGGTLDKLQGLKGAAPTNNGEAFRLYQQGMLLSDRSPTWDLKAALDHFEKAIELDPQFAGAYAGKAEVKAELFQGSNAHDDILQAREAAQKALELDASNSHAYAVLCKLQGTYDWDFHGAIKTCERAVELDPDNNRAFRELGFALNVIGEEQGALTAMERAVQLAPTSFNKRSRGLVLYYSRRFDEAIEQFKQIEETDPLYMETAKWIIRSYAMKRDNANAFEWYLHQKQRDGASANEIASIETAFQNDGWQGVLRLIVDAPGDGKPLPKNNLTAGTFAQLGEKDKAFEVLDNMLKRHALMLILIARNPEFDPLRDDPRFDQILRKMKLK
jgi:DNA-binding winged helix-turn-helix (wHTH) protein